MPTTTKGLPYPAATEPPNGPLQIQALADALDFTMVTQLAPAAVNNAAFLDAYPLGISGLSLASGDASAGGWPSGSSHVWTFKPTSTRAFQIAASTAFTRSWYRYLAASPGPNGQWTPWAYDDGWVNINPAGGVTGTLRYRQVGNVVYVQIEATATTVSGTALTLSGTALPAAVRPTVPARTGAYMWNTAGNAWVDTSGNVQVVQVSGSNKAQVSAMISYPLG